MEAQEPNMLDKILDWFPEEELLKADGLDDAIIGIESSTMRLVYSVSKCVNILMKDMSEEEALEYFHYNIGGAYMGEQTPIWCTDDV
jgi:hypothetical protein